MSLPPPSPQSQPQRAGRSGFAERANVSGGSPPPESSIAPTGGALVAAGGMASPLLPPATPDAIHAICADALEGALALVHADGGELFTLDPLRQSHGNYLGIGEAQSKYTVNFAVHCLASHFPQEPVIRVFQSVFFGSKRQEMPPAFGMSLQ